MKQHYFVVVLAHSLHGRLRRIHVPHQALYVVLALALFGSVSLFGMVSSYLRMSWKVANYNALRDQVDTLRNRYQQLQQDNIENFTLSNPFHSQGSSQHPKYEGPRNLSDSL